MADENQTKKEASKPAKPKRKVLKIILIVLLVIFLFLLVGALAGGGVYWWQMSERDAEKRNCESEQNELKKKSFEFEDKLNNCREEKTKLEDEIKDLEEEIKDLEEKEIVKCDFAKDVSLKETSKYGIFGDDEFDTLVCGYLELKDEVVFDEKQTNAYLVIHEFYDDEFRKSLDEGIAEGNTINQKSGSVYKFNLGCLQDGKIEGIEYEPGVEYINEATQKAITESTSENPVSLILSFGLHEGRGCECCNLAHKIRLY